MYVSGRICPTIEVGVSWVGVTTVRPGSEILLATVCHKLCKQVRHNSHKQKIFYTHFNS